MVNFKQVRIASDDARFGRIYTTAVAGLFLLALSVGAILLGSAPSAGAASECASSRAANANTKTSADGSIVYGSPCADRIIVTSPRVQRIQAGAGADVVFANAEVDVVDGGAGDDVLHGELPSGASTEEPAPPTYTPADTGPLTASASIETKQCQAGVTCMGGIGSQKLLGSSGHDRIFGQRGNDEIWGNEGDDDLFGGVGDEGTINGGPGDDLLAGGLGTDDLNGLSGADMARADGTTDEIFDTGTDAATDTVSFATAVTPGFSNGVTVPGFPAPVDSEERGVAIYLDGTACGEKGVEKYEACNNNARYGGGLDNVFVKPAGSNEGFEHVIGSPYADHIVGTADPDQIDGGGGADVILGKGGNDTIFGGPDGDLIKGEEGTDSYEGQGGSDNCIAETGETVAGCEGSAEAVDQRERSKISVGFMLTRPGGIPLRMRWVQLFLTGSSAADKVKIIYTPSAGTAYVTFTAEAGSALFDTSTDAASENCIYQASSVKCNLPRALDAITVAGMAGDDNLTLEGFPLTTSPILLGGEGSDVLTAGSGTEDLLVDGNGVGHDQLTATSYDDALINNEGADTLYAGGGNDLMLSASLCDGAFNPATQKWFGDTLSGSSGEDSSSWAKLVAFSAGVDADLALGKAGDTSSGSPLVVSCSGTERVPATLSEIEDLEGSDGPDQLYGNAGNNNLMGRDGTDGLWGRNGDDNIEAKETEGPEKDSVGGGPHVKGDTCSLDSIDQDTGCE
jgi:Ca2+-binding RTX toxin-like protein